MAQNLNNIIAIKVDDALNARLRREAEARGWSMSQLVRDVLRRAFAVPTSKAGAKEAGRA